MSLLWSKKLELYLLTNKLGLSSSLIMKLLLLVNDRLEMTLPWFLDITRKYTAFTSTISLETERSGSIEAYLFIDLFTSHKLVSGPSWPLSKTPPTPPNHTPLHPRQHKITCVPPTTQNLTLALVFNSLVSKTGTCLIVFANISSIQRDFDLILFFPVADVCEIPTIVVYLVYDRNNLLIIYQLKCRLHFLSESWLSGFVFYVAIKTYLNLKACLNQFN